MAIVNGVCESKKELGSSSSWIVNATVDFLPSGLSSSDPDWVDVIVPAPESVGPAPLPRGLRGGTGV